MKILVGIANYGTQNDGYMRQVIDEYRKMPYSVDLVVFSNVSKDLDQGIEVVVGLPNRNPWSLPFAHKPFFAERADDYDLFIYSEDDILITQRNVEAFLEATRVLPPDEIAGFLRTEVDPRGQLYFSTFHTHFHWDPDSVHSIGQYVFAYFSNEHSACYMLTREQLRRAIDCGRFLVGPSESKYHLPETAATDPYTKCGFKKMICMSHYEDFLVSHLSNKYLDRLGLEASEFYPQRDATLAIARSERPRTKLLNTETKVRHQKWSKEYYGQADSAVLSLLPQEVCSVMSVGCGTGLTELDLSKRGIRVVALPLDSIISSCAEAKGISVVLGDLQTAPAKLNGDRFDCILCLNILHLLPNPSSALKTFFRLLTPEGKILIGVPNFSYLPYVWRRLRRDPQFGNLDSYQDVGLNMTSRRVVRRWLEDGGFATEKIVSLVPERWQKLRTVMGRAANALFGSELIAVGRKRNDD